MKYAAPIRRVDTAKGHYYADANKTRVPGVTTILDKGLAKPALINWAGNATAEAAIDAWDQLCAMSPAERLNYLKKARYAAKDTAARRGTEIHSYGERLVQGESVEPPEELIGYIEGYAKFLDEFAVKPVLVEFGVASYKYGFAGTCDLVADVTIPKLGPKRLLIDLKSTRSGIFGEVAAQLAAYRYAEVVIGEPETPMVEVDGCAAVHITPTGSHLIPVTADESVYRAFLYIKQGADFAESANDLIGAAVTVPQASTYKLVRDEVGA